MDQRVHDGKAFVMQAKKQLADAADTGEALAKLDMMSDATFNVAVGVRGEASAERKRQLDEMSQSEYSVAIVSENMTRRSNAYNLHDEFKEINN